MKKIELDEEMKSKIIKNVFIAIVILIAVIFILKFLPLGEKKYYLDEQRYIEGPKLSTYKIDECVEDYKLFYDWTEDKDEVRTVCVNKITFKSLSSKLILELNRDNMLEKFNQKLCNNSHYLYDNGEYVLLTDFGIEKGLLFNTYYIKYIIGGINNGNCLMIKDSDKVELLYDSSYRSVENKDDIYTISYQYLNKDGKKYNVHSDCGDCLIIKNGMGKGTSFKEMLMSSYIDMDTLIEGLEYKVSQNKTKKVIYDDGVMYEHDQIHLLYCNNKEVYISDKIDYDAKMCK